MSQDPEPTRSKVEPKEKEPPPPEPKKFLETLPGMLTAAGGMIAAVATLITALSSAGVLTPAPATPTMTITSSPTWTLTWTPSPLPSATPTSSPTDTPTPPPPTATTAPPTLTLVPPTATVGLPYRDDFEDTQSGWFIEETESYALGYVDGAYYIHVVLPQYEVWATTDGVSDASDYIIEVDVSHAAGPADNDFGLLVRYDEGVDAFYMLAISSDGYYIAQRHEGDAWTELVPWAESSAIKQGLGASNHLRVECDGPTIRFFANGILLTILEDTTEDRGTVGLIAGTGPEGDVVVHFDNLVVHPLPD